MEFVFEMIYDQKAVAAMAKTLRKTVRKKRNRRTHVFGWIIVILGFVLCWPFSNGEFTMDFRTILTWAAILAMVIVLIWEDAINGYIARKRMLAGTEKATTVFREEGYYSTSAMGKTEWKYENIKLIAETAEYFVFIFSKSHAQVYGKKELSGGTEDEFRGFIEQKTGLQVEKIG